ncbi:MAG: hypothetical protein Q9191_006980, partial [Dirinaria sp. TL-2023a]
MTMSQKPPVRRTVYTGTFVHTPSLGKLEVLKNAAIGVDEHGVIAFIHKGSHSEDLNPDECPSDVTLESEVRSRVQSLGWGEQCENEERISERNHRGWKHVKGRKDGKGWFFPGFIDTHTHASQYPNTGLFGSSTLLDWLKKYTFPMESSFSRITRARHVYTRAITRSLAHGTTTAAYFATIHVPATNLLADLAYFHGQRAFIGRVCMDSDQNEPCYKDPDAATAIEKTKATITHISTLDPSHSLITPIITPRFAPSCTRASMSALGALAHYESLPIQTHISESPAEVELVASLFPESSSYAGVYDDHGLLTPRTVLAHGVHLTADEKQLISTRGASVSHCALSNSYLSSGLCPVRSLLDFGVNVGLGTDISGGYSPSMLAAAREAAGVSRILASQLPSATKTEKEEVERVKLSVEETLFLATVGGARALGLEKKVGTFEVGKEWDAQEVECGDWTFPEEGNEEGGVVEVEEPAQSGRKERKEQETTNPVELWGTESWAEKVAKWIFTGDDRNVNRVWVRGALVHERERERGPKHLGKSFDLQA